MAQQPILPFGIISWRDLTVPNAEEVAKFYSGLVGWQIRPEPMDGYNDFSLLLPGTGQSIAGICHARGPNADLPPQWLIYITVADIQQSVAKCQELGGTIVTPPRRLGGGYFCVIRDPAGAVCALFQAVMG